MIKATIFAYLALVFGVATWFVPGEARVPCLAATLACGALYFRAMNRRARKDAR